MKPAQPVAPGVRAMQLKELQRRLQATTYPLRSRAEKNAQRAETPVVKQQRAAVKRFDDANYARGRKAVAITQKRIDAARHHILFGDVSKALKLVEKLEAEARDA